MAELNYYPSPAATRLPHQTGLTAWGVLLIVAGSLFALSSLGSLALAVAPVFVFGARFGEAARIMILNTATAGTLAAALIWLGVGCCRKRRWVRPLLLAGGSVALVSGLLSLIPVGVTLASTVAHPPSSGPSGLPQPVLVAFTVIGLAFSALLMVGVPAGVVAWFRRPSVGQTLAILDPVGRWTDAVPLPVLAWVLACLWVGGGAIVAAAGGVWFFFTATVIGWPALASAAIGLGLMVAGYNCLRRSAAAWATSVALLALMAASAVTFVVAGDTAEYQRQLVARTTAVARSFGTPRPGPPTTGPSTGGTAVPTRPYGPDIIGRVNPQLAPSLLYVAAVAYGVWVRPRVIDRPIQPAM